MYILGISCYYHDSAAVLIKDGQLIVASEEERFSRIKHDSSFPKQSIDFCLKYANISVDDLSYVVFYEKPLLKFERIIVNTMQNVPRTGGFFVESMKEWFFDKLWVKSKIINSLGIDKSKLLFCEHHLSHQASSFFPSPFKKAATLSIDGVGEWTTVAWGIGDDKKITIKEEIHFPYSLGLLYSVFTSFAGFEVNEGEYKLMGLAPYGKPVYIDKIKKIIHQADDGSFNLDLKYFSYHYSLRDVYTQKFSQLFGKANNKSEKVIQYYADIAASVQYVFEETLLRIVDHVAVKSNLKNLCYAGGVALNSSANWKIATKSKFKDIYIQPAAGDSGGALGAAFWVYHTVLSKKRSFIMDSAYWGSSETEDETKNNFNDANIKYEKLSDSKLVEYIGAQIAKGKVVGWVQDRFEWGPRALGHRSILGNPKSIQMKDKVNSKIKFREGFRPFAPSVPADKGKKYFKTEEKADQMPFRFMLYVSEVDNKYKDKLQAITHVDGTARPQFVEKVTNPLYYNLMQSVGSITGVPVVLNTSFNLKGEPIVRNSKDAIRTFKKSGLDLLVVNNFIVKK